MTGPPQQPGFRSPSTPGSAPPRPAGHPGYRSRPRAHAASTSRPLPGGRGTRRCSGTRPGCSRIGGLGIRPAFSEKTFQRPGDLLQHQLHAADCIVLQFRIAPLRSGHDRMRPCREARYKKCMFMILARLHPYAFSWISFLFCCKSEQRIPVFFRAVLHHAALLHRPGGGDILFAAPAVHAGKCVILRGDPQQCLYALGSVSLVPVCFVQQNEDFRL